MQIINKILNSIKNCFLPTPQNHFEPWLLKDKIILAFILLFLLTKVLFSFQVLVLQQSSLFAELNTQKIIELTNQLRAEYGLPPVKENNILDKAAQLKAQDMATNNYFAHFSPSGISPWYWFQQAGYKYHYAGENLAMNFIDSEEVVKAWFNSPSHRENLLNKNYTEIGIAIMPGNSQINGLNRPIVVQLFGSPSTRVTPPINNQFLNNQTPSTTLPQQLVLGEEAKLNDNNLPKPTTTTKLVTTTTKYSQEITSNVSSSTITSPTTILTSSSITLIESNEKELSSSVLNIKDTRTRINNINKIIALLIIILGFSVIMSTILSSYKNTGINYPDIILRGFIVIVIGASFLAFRLESFIGHILVP